MLTKYKLVLITCLRNLFFCVGLLLTFSTGFSQEFQFSGRQQSQSIGFKLIKNLTIIPVFVNGKGPYDFVLDTGVGPMIITDPSIIDSLDYTVLRKINIAGLGTEIVEAYISPNISAQIGRAKIKRIPTAILKEDFFNLSGHLGIKIYGLIGYNFFNSFMVNVRYSDNKIVFKNFNSKIKYRGRKIPLEIYNQKPYVSADIDLPNLGKVRGKFLMDTGASHALSLEMFEDGAFPLPQKKIKANLGMSLSGQIKGYLGRVSKFYFGDYVFEDVISGFPSYESISQKIDLNIRNGNLGAEILKKFNIQFNYRDQYMYVKPNSNFRQPFEHDMVGMVVYLDQDTYKRYIIGEIDQDSPAERAGLCRYDEIIGINFKPIETYSLNDLAELFKSKADRSIIFEIYRDKEVVFKVVRLEKRI